MVVLRQTLKNIAIIHRDIFGLILPFYWADERS